LGKRVVFTKSAPAAIGPYAQAVRAGDLLFASGQIPLDPASGTIVPGNATAQTARVMENLGAILAAAGLGFAHVVRTTIYLTNLEDFPSVNEVYGSYFPVDPPARTTVQVAALPRGASVEIDLIAHVGA
jgi:2-iminobutanoate/2-iminopropanoate deaminase